jgi:hypothetical protein
MTCHQGANGVQSGRRQSISIMQLKWAVDVQSWLCKKQRVAMDAINAPVVAQPWVKLLQQPQFDLAECPDFLQGSVRCLPVQVDDCSDCLWTALREALVHIGVSTLTDDLRTEIMKYFSSKESDFSKNAKERWFDSPKESIKYQTVRNPVVVVMFVA